MADHCSFCGSTAGPSPVMTRAEMGAGLGLMATWALEQEAAANRQLIAAMRLRLAAGEQVARMYQEPGLAWLERQAEVAEELVARRSEQRRTAQEDDGMGGETQTLARLLKSCLVAAPLAV